MMPNRTLNLIDANWLHDLLEFFLDTGEKITIHGITSFMIALVVAFVLDNIFHSEYYTAASSS